MIYILLIFIVFVGGGALLGRSVGDALTKENDFEPSRRSKKDDSPMIVHNHITENHLHISKEDLKSLVDSKKSGTGTDL